CQILFTLLFIGMCFALSFGVAILIRPDATCPSPQTEKINQSLNVETLQKQNEELKRTLAEKDRELYEVEDKGATYIMKLSRKI
ncbi:hypothetical protein PMAYCL1PPCAC_11503, partial [Pristionchus mayeri]